MYCNAFPALPGVSSNKVKAAQADNTLPDKANDSPKKGKTARVEAGGKNERVIPTVVVSRSPGVGSGKAKVARAKVKPIDGGSKRSRTNVPEGMSEEGWAALSYEQRK